MVKFVCPNCGQHYEADEYVPDTLVQCSHCGISFCMSPAALDETQHPQLKRLTSSTGASRPRPNKEIAPVTEIHNKEYAPGCLLEISCGLLCAISLIASIFFVIHLPSDGQSALVPVVIGLIVFTGAVGLLRVVSMLCKIANSVERQEDAIRRLTAAIEKWER